MNLHISSPLMQDLTFLAKGNQRMDSDWSVAFLQELVMYIK